MDHRRLRARSVAAGLSMTRALRLFRLEAVAVAIGLLVLLGWAADHSVLTSISAGFAPTKPNTALALVLAGLALALVRPAQRPRWRDLAGGALAALVGAIGLVTLAEHAFGWNLRIDGLLFDVAQEVPNPSLRRMGVNTAFALVAVATSIILLARRRAVAVAQTGALVTALVALVSLLGYVYGAAPLEEGFFANVSRMALPTSLALLALSAAILLARPGVGVMAVASGADAGAVMFRRLVPPIVLVPILAGWLRLEGQQAGLYTTEIGLALHVSFLIAAMAALIWVTARSLKRSDQERNLVEQERARLAAHLAHGQRLEALGRLAGVIPPQ
jgi:hypothetical protein